MSAAGPTTTVRRDEPYVGPAPFDRDTPLYGRDREIRELTDLLIAERVVVLHSPSGAGKTSLIQSAVIPVLEREGFEVVGPLRVNAVPPPDLPVHNRYAWSGMCGIVGGTRALDAQTAGTSLTDLLQDGDPDRNQVLIFDQFEEVLTLDPTDWEGQREFFADVGRALRSVHRWALFSMREDFMGGLARYAVSVPSHLTVRYRLDFLERDAALTAVCRPAAGRGVEFTSEAAQLLVDDLSKVNVQRPGEQRPRKIPGPYVEPVQLQVVCLRLWKRLKQELGGDFKAIEPAHVKRFGQFDRALSDYYADAVGEVAQSPAHERAIRDWFDERLITKEGFRSQSSVGPQADGGDTEEILASLAGRYLIRGDTRGTTTWYELAHDRLVRPVRSNNKTWRREHLARWEYEADRWRRAERDSAYLLNGPDIPAARKWLKQQEPEPDPIVGEFLKASQDKEGGALAAQYGRTATLMLVIAVVEFVIIVILLLT